MYQVGPVRIPPAFSNNFPMPESIKLWNSVLVFAAAESRNVIIAFDETPSASGTLLGSDLSSFFSVQEISIKLIQNNKADNLLKVFFIG